MGNNELKNNSAFINQFSTKVEDNIPEITEGFYDYTKQMWVGGNNYKMARSHTVTEAPLCKDESTDL